MTKKAKNLVNEFQSRVMMQVVSYKAEKTAFDLRCDWIGTVKERFDVMLHEMLEYGLITVNDYNAVAEKSCEVAQKALDELHRAYIEFTY
jgi:hypothetical protein